MATEGSATCQAATGGAEQDSDDNKQLSWLQKQNQQHHGNVTQSVVANGNGAMRQGISDGGLSPNGRSSSNKVHRGSPGGGTKTDSKPVNGTTRTPVSPGAGSPGRSPVRAGGKPGAGSLGRSPVRAGGKPTSSPASRSTSSGSSSSSSDVSLPTPPDGGWGWVVVLASFLVHLIADGCAFSFGVLYSELLDYFGQSKAKTAWVGSLFVSVPLMTGPIASALTNRYGCRKTTIVGGLVAAVGFVLSSFANSIELLCVTFGIVAGFGLSMVYVPAVVIVAYYFEKKRAFATGIAVAGSGIGTFVFAPLSEFLIKQYSWKGAVLIIGGIMLNICACGAVFRPIIDEEEAMRKRARKRALDRMSGTTRSSQEHPDPGHEFRALLSGAPEKFPVSAQLDDELVVHSLVQFPTYLQGEISALPPDLLKEVSGGQRTINDILSDSELMDKYYATQSLTDVTHSVEDAVFYENGNHSNRIAGNNGASTSGHHANGSVKPKSPGGDLVWQKRCRPSSHGLRSRYMYDRLRPMYRKDIFYRGSLMRTGWNFPDRAASCPDIVMKTHKPRTDDLTIDKVFPLSCMTFSREVKHIITEMLDTSLLRSIIFVYFGLSSMLLYMWYDVPYVYTPDKAVGMGISQDHASYLVSILGIVSTVGQIVIGYLGDHPRVSALYLYNFLTSTAGIATVVVPLIPSYVGLCVYCGAFGFFISGNYALTTIILVDLLGMEKLTNAYGLIMLAEGISNLVGPPIAGWIRDQTGTYDWSFYIAGAGIFLSGFMLIIIPLLRRCDTVVKCKHRVPSNEINSTHSNHSDLAVNANHNNSNNHHGSDNVLCSGSLMTSREQEQEVTPLFTSRSRSDARERVSECESVV